MKSNSVAIFIILILVTLLQLVLQNCQHSRLKHSGCNANVVPTVNSLTVKCPQCRRDAIPYKSSENRKESEPDFLIPDDVTIDNLNESMLTVIYWRYINSLQFLCRNQTRVGQMKDGGKEICVDEKYRPREPCIVYSFGSNYDFEFEKDMTERFGCEVHTFDPSMTIKVQQAPSYTKFHKIGLAARDYRDTRVNWHMQRLSTIIEQLQHKNRTVDVLKIDIEGDEWSILPELFQSRELQRVRQICIEIHFGRVIPNRHNHTSLWGNVTFATQLKVLRKLYSEGFRIFMREHNTYRIQYFEKPFREITNVNEISLVNLNLEYGSKEFNYRRIFGDKASQFDIFR